DAALRIDGRAVAAERGKLALIGQGTVGLDIERDEASSGDVERLLVGAQDDSIRLQVFAVTGNLAGRADMEESTHREIEAAFAVGSQIVDHAAETIQRFAVIHVREELALRYDLPHGRRQAALDDKQRALLVHGKRASGIRVLVRKRNLAVLVDLHH